MMKKKLENLRFDKEGFNTGKEFKWLNQTILLATEWMCFVTNVDCSKPMRSLQVSRT